jgi:chemotaxis protein histidine kinase CheA
LDVPEPAANVKLGAPTFPKTPEETARRAEVAFTARIVERAPARVEAGQAPSTERPTLDAPVARRGSPVESIRAPEITLASGSPGPPPPDTEAPALEPQTTEAVSKNRQPTPQAKPAVSPHAPDQQPEKHEAAPEKWMKLDSLAQTTPRTESLRTESQSVAPRQATPAAGAREMAAEEPALASTRVPVRELRLQVPEAGREAGVEIRVRDQANEVNVSVRTRSPELAQSLRQALPDLVDRLGQRGLEAQVWRPAGSDIRVPAGERSLEILEAESAGNSPNQDGAGRGQTGSEGQRQPHSDDSQPGWTEEWARNFEASPDARDRSEWQ